jgi:hypothetical protein
VVRADSSSIHFAEPSLRLQAGLVMMAVHQLALKFADQRKQLGCAL